MERNEKAKVVEELHAAFSGHSGVLLIDFSGVNVADETELRRKVAQSGDYRVVKNTLALRAAKDTPVAALSDHFRGPTAIAVTRDDPVGLAKAVTEFIKAHPPMAFKGGVLEKSVLTAEDVAALAELPSREELLSKLVYLLQSPLTRLASALQSPLRSLASALKQVEEKKQS